MLQISWGIENISWNTFNHYHGEEKDWFFKIMTKNDWSFFERHRVQTLYNRT